MRTVPPAPDSTRWSAYLARVAWLALGLSVLRLAVLYAMARLSHGDDLAYVVERIATVAPGTVREAALAAALLVATVWVAGLPARRALRVLLGLLAVCLGGALVAAVLSGWTGDDYSRRVGVDTTRGRQVLMALCATGTALAAGNWLRRPRNPGTLSAAAPLLGLACVLLLGWVGTQRSQTFTLRETVGDLVADGEAWSVEPREAPRVAIVTPSLDYKRDGADMPALVLSPPSIARRDLGPDPGPIRLVGRFGIDHSEAERLAGTPPGGSLRLTVRLDGEELAAVDVRPPATRAEGSDWVDLGDGEGLDVSAGGVLELSTAFVDAEGSPAPADLLAGVGGLRLVRDWEVPRTPSSPEAPNLVLVVMDTLRRDRLGAYGYDRPTSPHLDALAARGTTFESAYSTASWTWPSTASILTGMLPEEHGVVGDASCYLADDLDTLAEVLQREGISTAAWSGNPLVVPGKHFDQGFESFESGRALMRRSRVFVPGALEWLDSIAGNRFFLYLHLVDPHLPYDPHPEARELLAGDVPASYGKDTLHELSARLLAGEGRAADGSLDLEAVVSSELRGQIDDMYDSCIRTGDRWLGEVVERLRALGLEDETLIVFTSDHGEELFDRGHGTHGHALHESLVGVPLVVAGPGIPAGLRVPMPVSNRHLAPTLAARMGAELDGLHEPVDLLDLVGAVPTGQEVIQFSTTLGWWNGTHPTPIFGLRSGGEILHFAPQAGPWGAEAVAGDVALYELSSGGPARGVDDPATAEALRDELLRRIEASEARRESPTYEAGSSTVDMLRGLGYIGGEE